MQLVERAAVVVLDDIATVLVAAGNIVAYPEEMMVA
jgi:hypothetical protein